ncbi:MAG TPA: hypothetical protein DD662_05840 [Planctomycetaceae bacterium]|nr:hypothetical protein [Planctomycetaceae bacterium]
MSCDQELSPVHAFVETPATEGRSFFWTDAVCSLTKFLQVAGIRCLPDLALKTQMCLLQQC